MNPTPEKRIKEALKKYLRSIGAYYYMPVSMGYGSTAIDFFVCHQGKFYGIETKRPTFTEPSPRQLIVLHEIADAGGGVWVENSLGLEKTRAVLGGTQLSDI